MESPCLEPLVVLIFALFLEMLFIHILGFLNYFKYYVESCHCKEREQTHVNPGSDWGEESVIQRRLFKPIILIVSYEKVN